MHRTARSLLPVAALVTLAAMAALWRWSEVASSTSLAELASLAEPYGAHWWSVPAMLLLFVVAALLLVPVLALVLLCGSMFGPWLGAPVALAGVVAGAILPFLAGRHLGRARVERWGGPHLLRLTKALDRRGILAVYLARKVPLPFTITNLICGASGVRLRDFVAGTLLGMGGLVVTLAVAGHQVLVTLSDPSPEQIELAAGGLLAGIGLALVGQRLLDRRAGTEAS